METDEDEQEQDDPDVDGEAQAKKRPRRSKVVDSGNHNVAAYKATLTKMCLGTPRRSDQLQTHTRKGSQSHASAGESSKPLVACFGSRSVSAGRRTNRKKNSKLFVPFQQIGNGTYLQPILVEVHLLHAVVLLLTFVLGRIRSQF